MDKLLFFVGKWQGKGSVIGKGIPFLEKTSFNVVRGEPHFMIDY